MDDHLAGMLMDATGRADLTCVADVLRDEEAPTVTMTVLTRLLGGLRR